MAACTGIPSDIIGAYHRVADVPLSEEWIGNVIAVYDGADSTARHSGLAWYPDCWEWCCSLGKQYNVSADIVAGIFSALSPQCTVSYAMAQTEWTLIRGFASGHTTMQCRTANLILAGGNADKLLGKYKTNHFYWDIVFQGLTDARVCIDTWQVRLITGNRRARVVKRAWYAYYVNVMQEAARRLTLRDGQYITAAELQAVTWVAYRGKPW